MLYDNMTLLDNIMVSLDNMLKIYVIFHIMLLADNMVSTDSML
jgi:hypothetical protein